MKVTNADIAAAEARIAEADAAHRAADAARTAALSAEMAAAAKLHAARDALEDLYAWKAIERLPEDLAEALRSGAMNADQWSSLVRRGLAGRSKDRWTTISNQFWLTRLGVKAQRFLKERAR